MGRRSTVKSIRLQALDFQRLTAATEAEFCRAPLTGHHGRSEAITIQQGIASLACAAKSETWCRYPRVVSCYARIALD